MSEPNDDVLAECPAHLLDILKDSAAGPFLRDYNALVQQLRKLNRHPDMNMTAGYFVGVCRIALRSARTGEGA